MADGLKMKIKRWFSRMGDECRDVVPLLSYALDRKLTFAERIRIRLHLLSCNACTTYANNIGFLHKVFHIHGDKIDSEEIQTTLSPDAKDRIRKALESKTE